MILTGLSSKSGVILYKLFLEILVVVVVVGVVTYVKSFN